MLRREVDSGSRLGRFVGGLMAEGNLVEDGLMNQIVGERLRQPDCMNGFLLDGYPRTVTQAYFLDDWLLQNGWDRPVALHFDVPNEELVMRLAGRRQCSQCGHIYGSVPNGGSIANEIEDCPRDGAPLVCRIDDSPAAVRERLQIYHRTAGPLLRHYQEGDYHCIAAVRSPDEVFSGIIRIFEDWQGALADPRPSRLAQFGAAN